MALAFSMVPIGSAWFRHRSPRGLAARLPSAAAREGQRFPAAAAHDARHGLLATTESGPGAAAARWLVMANMFFFKSPVIYTDLLLVRNHGFCHSRMAPVFCHVMFSFSFGL